MYTPRRKEKKYMCLYLFKVAGWRNDKDSYTNRFFLLLKIFKSTFLKLVQSML